MSNTNVDKRHGRIIPGILKIIFFVAFSFAAIKIGFTAGDIFYSNDYRIIGSIDTQNFKIALNQSLPIIDTIYNSGNVSVSFSLEIRKALKAIYGFDLSSPITVLNVQSPFFQSYYNTGYKELIASKEEKSKANKLDYSEIHENNNASIENASSTSIEDKSEEKKVPEGGVVSDGRITVYNETKYKINIDDLLKEPLKIKYDRKGPKVLIYHTHTTESYINNISQLDRNDVPAWNEDSQYNVVRVGEELAQNLRKKYGIEVIHNGTRHDYPNSNGAYSRSLDTIGKILKSYPSIKIVLDIHRDGKGNDEKLRVVSNVNSKTAAQAMFVVGTNGIGLSHPNWKENLKLALKLQEKLNEQAPGLAKPTYISVNRYNQHVTPGAVIIEIGGDGNTLDEAIETTKYLAKAISEVIN